MTDKELLYIEDTLSHLEQINDFCTEYGVELEDENFKMVLDKLVKESKSIHGKFLKLLED